MRLILRYRITAVRNTVARIEMGIRRKGDITKKCGSFLWSAHNAPADIRMYERKCGAL